MNDNLANPKVLGFTSIFISGWMISMLNAGWFMGQDPRIGIVLGLILGGVVVALAGVFSYFKGQTFETTLFLVFGALFFVYSLVSLNGGGMGMSHNMAYYGWLDILWAVFFFYMWIPGIKKGLWMNLFLIAIWLMFLALGIGHWANATILGIIGGYLGLIAALIAGWLAFSDLMETTPESAS